MKRLAEVHGHELTPLYGGTGGRDACECDGGVYEHGEGSWLVLLAVAADGNLQQAA